LSTAKRLVGQTALYGVSSIVGRALNYLLVPVHTAVLAPAAFGVMSELYAYVAFFNVLAVYGLETSLFRFANRPGADRDKAYQTALTLVVGSSILLTILLSLLAPALANWLGYADQTTYLVWLAVIIGIDAVASLAFAKLRLEGKAARFATVRIINIVVNVLLNLFFLYLCPKVVHDGWLTWLRPLVELVYDPNLGVGYIFLANLIANLLFLPLLWPQLSAVKLRLDWAMGKAMITYGYPLMLMGLAGMVNEVLNRPLLKLLLPDNFYHSAGSAWDLLGQCKARYFHESGDSGVPICG
jgi:O-antigen/teichoic acid export membrane protein